MRNRQWNGCAGDNVHYGNTYVQNVTHITQTYVVTHTPRYSGRSCRRAHQEWSHGHGSRKTGPREPKLLRFCKSCGILDQDKVMRMSDGEIVDGLLDVERHVRHDMARHASGMCHDLCCCGRSVAGAVKGLIGAAVGLLK